MPTVLPLCRPDVMLVASNICLSYFAFLFVIILLLMPPTTLCSLTSQTSARFTTGRRSSSGYLNDPNRPAPSSIGSLSGHHENEDNTDVTTRIFHDLPVNNEPRKHASKRAQEASFAERMIQKHRKGHSSRAKKRALVKRDLINRPTSFRQLIARYVGPMNNDVRGLMRPITAIERGNYLTNQQVSQLLSSDGMGNQKSVAEQPFKVLYHRHSGRMLSVHPDGSVMSSDVENRLCEFILYYIYIYY